MASLPYPLNRLDNHGIVGMARMPYPPTDCRSYIMINLNTYLSINYNWFSCSHVFPKNFDKWRVKSEKWRIQWLSEKRKVKSEKWRIQWFKWGYRKKGVLGNAQPNLIFSFCSSNPFHFFSCSHVLLSIKNHVLLFSCLPKNHVLLFSCLPQKPCSSV